MRLSKPLCIAPFLLRIRVDLQKELDPGKSSLLTPVLSSARMQCLNIPSEALVGSCWSAKQSDNGARLMSLIVFEYWMDKIVGSVSIVLDTEAEQQQSLVDAPLDFTNIGLLNYQLHWLHAGP
ncbi:unnamed protein product [Cercospora beticola]|nr:unnamed protein product [Cercospora beticola]